MALDDNAHLKAITTAPLEDLVETHFFIEQSQAGTDALIDAMVARSSPNSFSAVYRVFPDHPRDANDVYFAHAVAYLMGLAEKRATVEWLPAWLAPSGQRHVPLEDVISRLLEQCLTYFKSDEARNSVLLATTAIRRLLKLMFLTNENQWRAGEVLHALARYHLNELSWSQVVSSPEGHVSQLIATSTMLACQEFVRQCRDDQGRFRTEVAKAQSRALWNTEARILQSIDNYGALCKERNLGDLRVTEAAGITYDYLGHATLCVISRFPKWIEYVRKYHSDLLLSIAGIGSWKARELLGLAANQSIPRPTEGELALRFFFGDVVMLNTLRKGYGGLL